MKFPVLLLLRKYDISAYLSVNFFIPFKHTNKSLTCFEATFLTPKFRLNLFVKIIGSVLYPIFNYCILSKPCF